MQTLILVAVTVEAFLILVAFNTLDKLVRRTEGLKAHALMGGDLLRLINTKILAVSSKVDDLEGKPKG